MNDDSVIVLEPLSPAPSAPSTRIWRAIDRFLERVGDHLNPILVKETRQSLKSRQFLLTFGLLLIVALGWSILGIAFAGPGAAMGSHGKDMFVGFFAILAFPLMIIVPSGAFRSLASEQENRTYELLSVTLLGSRQVIRGKLGSAIVQMSVYLSAITPCLGFTYLLRGIDLLSILIVLFWLTLVSLGLTGIALFLGAMASKKQHQVLPSIGIILGSFWLFGISISLVNEFLRQDSYRLYYHWQFWTINGAILTGFIGYFLLVCEAAAARLSFPSDNRSTRLRMLMVLLQMLLTGWMFVLWNLENLPSVHAISAMIFMIWSGLQWYVFGALMISESPNLSSRVKRQLPQSFLGRIFFTWFFPGPAKGYAFTLTGLFSSAATVAIGVLASNDWQSWGRWPSLEEHIIPLAVLGISYVTIYLGIGLLLLRAFSRFATFGAVLSVLIQFLFLLLGCLIPVIIQLSSTTIDWKDSVPLEVINPLWTLFSLVEGRSTPNIPTLMWIVPVLAIVVFFLVIPGLIREILSVRILKPERVLEEEAERK